MHGIDRIAPGQAQYTLCCAEDGGVVDDLIAYLRTYDEVFLVPNAANTAEVVRRLTAAAPAGIGVVEQHELFAVLAVQGPRSAEVLTGLGLPTDHDYMSFTVSSFQGTDVVVCRPSDSALPLTCNPSLQATIPITSAMNGALRMPTSK